VTRARWAVFAYHTIGARALEALVARGEDVAVVVTHADDPGEGDWFESVAEVARIHRIPCLTPTAPNLPEVGQTIRELAPDLILSVWYRRLLGPELLALPRIAALNLHGSLLPAYRGRAPLNWVLVNGEPRTGVTLHHMTAAADAGDVVAQRTIDIEPDDTAFTLYERMTKVGIELLLEAYPAVLDGTAPRVPQDHARATTMPRRRPEDGRIEWTWPTWSGRSPLRIPVRSSATARRAFIYRALRFAAARPSTPQRERSSRSCRRAGSPWRRGRACS